MNKFDPNKPCVTSEGHPVRVLCTDRDDPEYPIVALVPEKGTEVVRTFTAEGDYFIGGPDTCWDLRNAPPVSYAALMFDPPSQMDSLDPGESVRCYISDETYCTPEAARARYPGAASIIRLTDGRGEVVSA